MISGIILAAGSSSRFKHNKLLVDWFGVPLLRHICMRVIASAVDQTLVVLKSGDNETLQAINDLPLQIVFNPASHLGQSTSIKIGLTALLASEAVIIILADQPFLSTRLIKKLVAVWKEKHAAIVAPFVDGKRATPVLFDRETYHDLLNISGDSGGRQLFGKYTVWKADWKDPKILLDIDTGDNLLAIKDLIKQ